MANKKKETIEEQTTAKSSEAKDETNTKEKLIIKDVDLSQFIPVHNGFQGRLVYVSPRTKEKFVWDEFGDVQDIELRELKNAKSASKNFFLNNWFMFDDDYSWVVDYLGLNKFYKHAISVDDFDDIFDENPEEIKKIISELSNGQKRSISYRARTLISEDKIDSRKVITALENALGESLIER